MISVVMPVYNGVKYLCESIESIIQQDYKDWELIIINDCSTDSSFLIAKKYADADERIHVFSNEINQKLPKSLNIGFQKCRGEYLTWTSDDNIFLPNAFSTMLNVLIEKEDVSFVFANQQNIDDEGNYVNTNFAVKSIDEIFVRNIVGACFMFRRGVFIELQGYDPDKFLVEDYDFALRAYEKFGLCYINEVLYKYRFHCSSLTTMRREQIIERTVALLKEQYEKNSNPDIRKKISKGISYYYLDLYKIYVQKIKENNSNVFDMMKVFFHYYFQRY